MNLLYFTGLAKYNVAIDQEWEGGGFVTRMHGHARACLIAER